MRTRHTACQHWFVPQTPGPMIVQWKWIHFLIKTGKRDMFHVSACRPGNNSGSISDSESWDSRLRSCSSRYFNVLAVGKTFTSNKQEKIENLRHRSSNQTLCYSQLHTRYLVVLATSPFPCFKESFAPALRFLPSSSLGDFLRFLVPASFFDLFWLFALD